MQTSPCASKFLLESETEESPSKRHETRRPVAFDIPVQSPILAGWNVVSLAKERLKNNVTRKSPDAGQKLEEVHRQKCQKAAQFLIDRKEKARRHNERVAKRVQHVQQRRLEQAETKQMLDRWTKLMEVQLNQCTRKTCEHQEKVGLRKQAAQQQWEEHEESIRATREQKKGSTVKSGETEDSRGLADTNKACLPVLLEDTAIHPAGNGCLSLKDFALPVNIQEALNALVRYMRDSGVRPFSRRRDVRARKIKNDDMQI